VSGKDISPSFGKINSAFSLSMFSRIRQLLSHRLRGIGKLKERCTTENRLTLTDRVTSFSLCGALLSVSAVPTSWKIISRRLNFLAFRVARYPSNPRWSTPLVHMSMLTSCLRQMSQSSFVFRSGKLKDFGSVT